MSVGCELSRWVFLSNNLLFNQLTNNNLISFASTSYWDSTEMDCSRRLFSVQLGGDSSHWSVLGQLATLDSVSPIGTLIANVAIFDEISALTSTERWLIVCLFVCFKTGKIIPETRPSLSHATIFSSLSFMDDHLYAKYE